MPASLPHPKDPRVQLTASRPPFGEWRLRVNGVAQEAREDGTFLVRLSDGTPSEVEVTGRAFDPFPIFVIDGVTCPLGLPLGVTGALAALLPLLGFLGGFIGLVIGLLGAVIVLRVARRTSGTAVRLAAGVAMMVVAWFIGVASYYALGPGRDLYRARPSQPTFAALPPLDAVPGIPAGAEATWALAQLPPAVTAAPVPAGTEAFAPFTIADLDTLRAAVRDARFGEADTILNTLEREARTDVRRESRWRAAYRMGFQAQPAPFASMLDRWVSAEPGSPTAYLARGWHDYWMAYYWAHDNPSSMDAHETQAFGAALAHAAQDAVEALRRDPDQLPAYWLLQNIARTDGDSAAVAALLARVLARSPTSYQSYVFAMNAYYPEWGGTAAQMEALAAAGAARSGENPELGRLRGFVHWKAAEAVVEDGAPAVPEADAALATGPDFRFYHVRGHAAFHAMDVPRARRMLDSAVALEPTDELAYVTRYKFFGWLGSNGGAAGPANYDHRDADLKTIWHLRPMMEE